MFVFTHKMKVALFAAMCIEQLCEFWLKCFAKAVVSVSLVQIRILLCVCERFFWVIMFIPSQDCWDISVCCCR